MFFIDYQYEDKLYAERIVHDMEKEGLKCWHHLRDLRTAYGNHLNIIPSVIRKCDGYILLFTHHTNNINKISNEFSLAIKWKAHNYLYT